MTDDTTTLGFTPDWPTCAHDTGRCTGRRIDEYEHCLAHLARDDLDAALGRLTSGADLDLRGTTLNAQLLKRLLTHMNNSPADPGSPAHLGRADFSYCWFPVHDHDEDPLNTSTTTPPERVQIAGFAHARFDGDALFVGARFSGTAKFSGAKFSRTAKFSGAWFERTAGFGGARFSGTAKFGEVQFSGTAEFSGAQFSQHAWFGEAQFSGTAKFDGAQFGADAEFSFAQFSGHVRFWHAQFSADAEFNAAQFSADAYFIRVHRFCDDPFCLVLRRVELHIP